LTLTCDLDYQSKPSYGHNHTKKLEFKGQSVEKLEWKQTDEQTNATDWFVFPAITRSLIKQ